MAAMLLPSSHHWLFLYHVASPLSRGTVPFMPAPCCPCVAITGASPPPPFSEPSGLLFMLPSESDDPLLRSNLAWISSGNALNCELTCGKSDCLRDQMLPFIKKKMHIAVNLEIFAHGFTCFPKRFSQLLLVQFFYKTLCCFL